MRFDSSIPTRTAHSPVISTASWARPACVRAPSLRSRTSAGRLCTRLPARLYAHSVCRLPHSSGRHLHTLSRPMETSWVCLWRSSELRCRWDALGCACLRAVYELLRVCARSVIRPCCRCRADFACTYTSMIWCCSRTRPSILETDNDVRYVLDTCTPSAWVLWEGDTDPWGATWARMDFVGPPPFAAP